MHPVATNRRGPHRVMLHVSGRIHSSRKVSSIMSHTSGRETRCLQTSVRQALLQVVHVGIADDLVCGQRVLAIPTLRTVAPNQGRGQREQQRRAQKLGAHLLLIEVLLAALPADGLARARDLEPLGGGLASLDLVRLDLQVPGYEPGLPRIRGCAR